MGGDTKAYIFNDIDEISFDFLFLFFLLENERRQVSFILELPNDVFSLVIKGIRCVH